MNTEAKKKRSKQLITIIIIVLLGGLAYYAAQKYIGLLSDKERAAEKQQAVSNKMTTDINSGANLGK